MTWDEIYKAADGCACGDENLVRKDNARYSVVCFIQDVLNINIESAECPEEEIDYYTEKFDISFDEDGNINNK